MSIETSLGAQLEMPRRRNRPLGRVAFGTVENGVLDIVLDWLESRWRIYPDCTHARFTGIAVGVR